MRSAPWCFGFILASSGATTGSAAQTKPAAPLKPPALTLAFTLHVQVGPPMELGICPPDDGGSFRFCGGYLDGPLLRGKVLPGGADWQIVQADGLAKLDTRYTLQTHDGKLIYIQNAGVRHASPEATTKLLAGEAVDPSQVYFKTVPTFETAAPELQWLDACNLHRHRRAHPTEVVVHVWRVD